jgi:hypothetical protein
MKSIITAFSAVTLACTFPAAAQVQQTDKTTDIAENADGSVTKTETETTTTFDPAARSKVVKYFDTYKTNPHGLPPAWTSKVKIKDVPMGWRTTRIEPGLVIEEKERSFLVEAPADLVEVLPPPATNVRYYMAGSNVVAVDANYKVVDSIQIPSIKIEVDD